MIVLRLASCGVNQYVLAGGRMLISAWKAIGLRRKSRINLFGINRPKKCTFIPMGGPQAHANSKPCLKTVSETAIFHTIPS